MGVAALFLTPFIDRGKLQAATRRTVAIGVVALAALGWTGLTVAAIATTPKTVAIDVTAESGAEAWEQLSPVELAGIGYFRKENCVSCHTLGGAGSRVGPDLSSTSIRRDAKWMIEHFKRPQAIAPGTAMPPIHLPDAQLNALAAFLLKLTPKNAEALQQAPDFAVEGAVVYQNNRCGACHQVNGVGMKLGPGLNGLAARRSRDWVEQHFAEPQKLSPGSTMPPYRFSSKDLDRISSYLMALD
jgi:ubiquinol-cytochrome c reductase cytochrome b subunit